MKNRILLLSLILLTLTACGKGELTDPVELTTEVSEELIDQPYIPTIYYYEVDHADTRLCMTIDSGVTPYGEILDYDAYMQLDPLAVFYDGENFLYVGITSCEDYSQYEIGTIYLSAINDEVLEKFKESIIELSSDANYIILEMPELRISDEVIEERRQDKLTGYDNYDVASYAFVTLKDGTEGAVCYTWRGDFMEMVVLGLDNHVCSLRNDDSELLVEDTGEVFELNFYANSNYDPYSNNQ